MAILPISGGGTVQRVQSGTVRGSTGFSVPEEAGESVVPLRVAAGQAACVFSLSAMLDLQEIERPQERNRKAKRRGESLLSALSRLQLSLLHSTEAKEIYTEISQLSTELPLAADPALRSLVDEIRQRSAVELARHEMAASRNIRT
jgi:hypothetical protein